MFKVGVEYVGDMDTIVDVKFLEIDRDDLDFRPRIWGRHRNESPLLNGEEDKHHHTS